MGVDINDILNSDGVFPAVAGWRFSGVRTDAAGVVQERGDIPMSFVLAELARALNASGVLRSTGSTVEAVTASDTPAHNIFSLFSGVTERLFGAESISKTLQLQTSALSSGNRLQFTFPDNTLDRAMSTYTEGAGDITVGLGAAPAGWNRVARMVAVHKNTGGANAEVFAGTQGTLLIRDTIANPTVPEIAPGKFALITIEYLPLSPTPVGVVRVVPVDLGTLRKTPRIGLTGNLPSTASAVTNLTGVQAGDLVLLMTRRFNTTHAGPTSPAITWLQSAVADTTVGWNQSARLGAFVAGVNDPPVTNPNVVTNTQWFQILDAEPFVPGTPLNTFPVSGLVKVTAVGNAMTILGPAAAHSEPLLWLTGFATGGSVTWVLPPEGDLVNLQGGAGSSGVVSFKHPLATDCADLVMPTAPAHGIAFHAGIRGSLYS